MQLGEEPAVLAGLVALLELLLDLAPGLALSRQLLDRVLVHDTLVERELGQGVAVGDALLESNGAYRVGSMWL